MPPVCRSRPEAILGPRVFRGSGVPTPRRRTFAAGPPGNPVRHEDCFHLPLPLGEGRGEGAGGVRVLESWGAVAAVPASAPGVLSVSLRHRSTLTRPAAGLSRRERQEREGEAGGSHGTYQPEWRLLTLRLTLRPAGAVRVLPTWSGGSLVAGPSCLQGRRPRPPAEGIVALWPDCHVDRPTALAPRRESASCRGSSPLFAS